MAGVMDLIDEGFNGIVVLQIGQFHLAQTPQELAEIAHNPPSGLEYTGIQRGVGTRHPYDAATHRKLLYRSLALLRAPGEPQVYETVAVGADPRQLWQTQAG